MTADVRTLAAQRLPDAPSTTQDRDCGADIDVVPAHQVDVNNAYATSRLRAVAAIGDPSARAVACDTAIRELTAWVVDAKGDARPGLCDFTGEVEVVFRLHDNAWTCPRCGTTHEEDPW